MTDTFKHRQYVRYYYNDPVVRDGDTLAEACEKLNTLLALHPNAELYNPTDCQSAQMTLDQDLYLVWWEAETDEEAEQRITEELLWCRERFLEYVDNPYNWAKEPLEAAIKEAEAFKRYKESL